MKCGTLLQVDGELVAVVPRLVHPDQEVLAVTAVVAASVVDLRQQRRHRKRQQQKRQQRQQKKQNEMLGIRHLQMQGQSIQLGL